MVTFHRRPPASAVRALYQVVVPTLAGGVMLWASLLPWLADPLGARYTAWQLPVDLGWQVRSGAFNYGLLCLCGSLSAFLIAAQAWRSARGEQKASSGRLPPLLVPQPPALHICAIAALICLVPLMLFLTQYLFIDMGSIAQLTRHELQTRLLKSHLDYGTAAQFIPIQAMTFNPLTLHSRAALLFDQVGGGFFLPLLSTLLLLAGRGLFPRATQKAGQRTYRRVLLPVGAAFLLLLVLVGRGPAALACNFQAQHLLAEGNYADALTWLDRAYTLNPALDQLSSYHIERGQAWYYLHPAQPTLDSQVYLAAFYRQQNDYLSSYQELLSARQGGQGFSWLIDEQNITLERLAEQPHPLVGAPALRLHAEAPATTWLSQMLQIDPSNVYGHYTLGRLKYDLHDYAGCEVQMLQVLRLSQDNDIQSSAYTYLGLSSAGEGDAVTARHYLFKAQEMDTEFRNNIAREELSGLR